MSDRRFHNWQSVQQEVLRRINSREWKPGDLIPNEADLATEFGCARTTVNRALREIAETGLLQRKRKAGTRISERPVARAMLDIPVIRTEIEERGQRYQHQLIDRKILIPPNAVSGAMATPARTPLLRLNALHLANAKPYAYEDRWINLDIVPDAREEPFNAISANEWLLKQSPYTHGDITFSATSAREKEAEALGCLEGAALFVIDRITWNQNVAVTKVTITFAEGHQMHASL